MSVLGYRCWGIKEEQYLKLHSIHLSTKRVIVSTFGRGGGNISLPFDRVVLEQDTGLRDGNGVKIYEGDIVRINDDYEEYGTNAGRECEIWFKQGGFRYKPEPWSMAYKMGQPGCWLDDGADCEVIGNIHENGELVKEKE